MVEKRFIVTIVVVVLVLALSSGLIYLRNNSNPDTSEQIAKCIGEKAVVYTQVGCIHCERQKDLFGENFKYIPEIICNKDNWQSTCFDIEGTPTWKIGGQTYTGYKDLDTLRQLTGC